MDTVIEDEEIYELRQQGLTYQAIAEHFNGKGISISGNTIRIRCKEIYSEKGKEEPKSSELRRKVSNEEIYELREKGKSYNEIAEIISYQKDIDISFTTIRIRCKEIYAEKGKEEPKSSKLRRKISNEEIYILREQRYTYNMIVEYFKAKGISISEPTIIRRCKEIYAEKGEKEPKSSELRREVSDEKIYELREQGLTYQTIIEHFDKKGISISESTIIRRCKEIYAEKRKEKPKITKKDQYNEEIYELRKQGLTYQAIAEHFNGKGISISWDTIRKRCKEIYAEKGEEEPKTPRYKPTPKIDIDNEEIYELRQQGLTYQAITEYFNGKGISTCLETVRKRCKEIYDEKGKEEPKALEYISKLRIDKYNEEIYELRESGLGYEAIAEYFYKKGIDISPTTVRTRCKEIYAEKGEEEPKLKPGVKSNGREKISNKQLAQAILKLAETRKATVDQIKTIAEYYQVDLEKVFEDAEER